MKIKSEKKIETEFKRLKLTVNICMELFKTGDKVN